MLAVKHCRDRLSPPSLVQEDDRAAWRS